MSATNRSIWLLAFALGLSFLAVSPLASALTVFNGSMNGTNNAVVQGVTAGNVFCVLAGGTCNTTNEAFLLNDPTGSEQLLFFNFTSPGTNDSVTFVKMRMRQTGGLLFLPFRIVNNTAETGGPCETGGASSIGPGVRSEGGQLAVETSPGGFTAIGGTYSVTNYNDFTFGFYRANSTIVAYVNGTLAGSATTSCSWPSETNRALFAHTGGGETGTAEFRNVCVYDGATGNETFDCFAPPPVTNYTLTLDTVPSGATFSVNGSSVGTGPLSISLLAGDYSITASLTGYYSFSENYSLVANATRNYTLTPLNYTWTIDSVPSGASLRINGTLIGLTPQTVQRPAGSYLVALNLTNYTNASNVVSLTANTTTNTTLSLTSAPGTVDDNLLLIPFIAFFIIVGIMAMFLDPKEYPYLRTAIIVAVSGLVLLLLAFLF